MRGSNGKRDDRTRDETAEIPHPSTLLGVTLSLSKSHAGAIIIRS